MDKEKVVADDPFCACFLRSAMQVIDPAFVLSPDAEARLSDALNERARQLRQARQAQKAEQPEKDAVNS